jgi:hypothetical protein
MQEEIREAQAAVDACYRRRVEHAGIEVELPGDRFMTEEELDGLSEQLGDGAGAQAKRRREIERMSVAEMEANNMYSNTRSLEKKYEKINYPGKSLQSYIFGFKKKSSKSLLK